MQDRLVDLAGRGTDPDDSTKPLSNVTITADDMDGQATFTINTTVTYQFVDDDNNGSAVGKPVVATGLNGKSQLVHLTVPEGYALVAGQTLPATANFGDTNSTVDIHLKHATKTVDKNNVPDGYTKDDFAKEIKRSITAKAVSYTHLDVYKRQMLHSTLNYNYTWGLNHVKDWDGIITLTPQQQKDVKARFEKYGTKIYRIPGPIVPKAVLEAKHIPFEQRTKNQVVMVARLSPEKQQDHLLKAWPKILEKVPTAKLDFWGYANDNFDKTLKTVSYTHLDVYKRQGI